MKKTKSIIALMLCFVMCTSFVSVFASSYAERYVTLYTEDGRTKAFPESQVSAQLTVGWYTEPVQRLYAEGKSKVFKKSEVPAQLTVGWYTEPVQRLYAAGKSKLFKKSEVPAQLTVGWYTKPFVQMWALDGRSKYVPAPQVAANQKVGWYTLVDYTIKKADTTKKTSYSDAVVSIETLMKNTTNTADYNKLQAKKDSLCAEWYMKNNWCPVVILGSSIQSYYGIPTVGVALRNVTAKTIRYMQIVFTCLDAYGNPTTDYSYLYNGTILGSYDEDVPKGQSESIYWVLDDNTETRSISGLHVQYVEFEDGTTWGTYENN